MKAEMNGINAEAVKKLKAGNMTVSAAESCTGGMFSALVTEVAGASEVFCESIVTYSNEAKMRELGVLKDTLDTVGAVSAETAEQMCIGIAKHTGADVGIGITGIAGPGGGTKEKPVGTVFAGISVRGRVFVYRLQLDGDRGSIREAACRFVFERLNEIL